MIMSESDHNVLREITSQLANDYFSMYEPILSAAAHLSLKDSTVAYHKLIRAHEPYYVFVLAKLLRLPHEELLQMLARQAERYRVFYIGLKLLENHSVLKELFESRASTPNIHAFYQQMNIRSPREYSALGEMYLADRNLTEAIRNRLQSGEGLDELFTIWSYLGYLRL